MPTPIHEKVRLANSGRNPQAIAKLKSGWVLLHEFQTLPGYCLLLSDPTASSLNELSESSRAQYCLDMARVGDALLEVCGARRVNYETWCNQDPALHTHIVPRFESEPDALRRLPALKAYDLPNGKKFDRIADRELMLELANWLDPYSVGGGFAL